MSISLRDADKRVGEFSKGMRGRLTLARALLHRPELLFLDEPTAGLDPVTARRIRKVIRDARDGGATIFLTTHDMTTADELCDRVAFLVDGHIAAVDAPRALRLAHGRRVVRVETVRNDARRVAGFRAGRPCRQSANSSSMLRDRIGRDDSHVGDHARGSVRADDGEDAVMTRWWSALRFDVLLQARQGFYAATAAIVILLGGSAAVDPRRTARANSDLLGAVPDRRQPADHDVLLRVRIDACSSATKEPCWRSAVAPVTRESVSRPCA